MKLLEIILWMGAAAQVYFCPSMAKQWVVRMDGYVITNTTVRPSRDTIRIAIESKI